MTKGGHHRIFKTLDHIVSKQVKIGNLNKLKEGKMTESMSGLIKRILALVLV